MEKHMQIRCHCPIKPYDNADPARDGGICQKKKKKKKKTTFAC